MKFWTYILYSETCNRHYCGSTNDIERRLKQHNSPGETGARTTRNFPGPWTIIWKQESDTRSEAMKLEYKIKKRGAKRFLEGR